MLGHRRDVYMALADATQQFSAGGKPIGTPPAVDEGSSRSTFSPAVGVVCLSTAVILEGYLARRPQTLR